MVPHLVTSGEPGDLFVVRVLGGIVSSNAGDPTLAALEYAVGVLEVSDIVVCGHSDCGAMRALYEEPPEGLTHLSSWIDHARAVAMGEQELSEFDPTERFRITTERCVVASMERLKRHASGNVNVHGWYYEIGTGEVTALDPETGSFTPIN